MVVDSHKYELEQSLLQCFSYTADNSVASAATKRDCWISVWDKAHRAANKEIVIISQILATLLPGECRSAFQKEQQILREKNALATHYISVISPLSNSVEMGQVLRHYVGFANLSLLRDFRKAQEKIKKVCHP